MPASIAEGNTSTTPGESAQRTTGDSRRPEKRTRHAGLTRTRSAHLKEQQMGDDTIQGQTESGMKQTGPVETKERTFDTRCSDLRLQLKDVGERIQRLKRRTAESATQPGEDRSEELANLTLAFRHLEDAEMRLGKAIQAYDGGRSVYDATDRSRTEENS